MLVIYCWSCGSTEIYESSKRKSSQKGYTKICLKLSANLKTEPAHAAEKKQVLEMNVQTSKCLIGIKALHVDQTGDELLKE